MDTIKVAIIGATGYTGSELIRILTSHPEVDIQLITSESHTGKTISEIYPQYVEFADMVLEKTDKVDKFKLDLVFLALPHGASMKFVKKYGFKKFKLIDLSGDFRLKSAEVYRNWYGNRHIAPYALKKAVFGLPELYRNNIRKAQFVANPGCYPTSAILALTPLLKNGLINPKDIIIDSKSGVTGAGSKPTDFTHFPEVFGNFSPYALLNHRHKPEIEYVLSDYTSQEVDILFTPYLLPVDRGIFTTTYSTAIKEISEDLLEEIFANFYKSEYFVRVVNQLPGIKNVRGSNFCDIFVTYDRRTQKVITFSVIDNLVKGAAGQAVQNMNIMFNLIEYTGLNVLPLSP